MEYCPTGLDVCVVEGRNGPVHCLSYSSTDSFAQFIWPSGFFYVMLILLIFAFTRRGQYLVQFMRRKSVGLSVYYWQRVVHREDSNDNDDTHIRAEEELLIETANRILAQPGRPVLLNEDFIRRESHRIRVLDAQRRRAETAQVKRKKNKQKEAFALRTKSFTVADGSSLSLPREDPLPQSDECQEHECAICFEVLAEGDVIGDIPCGHLFHKDCLKTWVKRKKRCPLCQDEGLLLPQRDGYPVSVVPETARRADDEVPTGTTDIGRTFGMSTTDSDTTSNRDDDEPQVET